MEFRKTNEGAFISGIYRIEKNIYTNVFEVFEKGQKIGESHNLPRARNIAKKHNKRKEVDK